PDEREATDEHDDRHNRFGWFQAEHDQVKVDLQVFPCGKVDRDNVIGSSAGETLIDLNGRSVLREQGSHGVGAVAKRCVAALMEHKHVERMTPNFGEISAQAALP